MIPSNSNIEMSSLHTGRQPILSMKLVENIIHRRSAFRVQRYGLVLHVFMLVPTFQQLLNFYHCTSRIASLGRNFPAATHFKSPFSSSH